ncbi:MAG: hypothetical protein ACOY0T_31255 [Myxococcota bacterium]
MSVLSMEATRKKLGDREFDLRECVTEAWAQWKELSKRLPSCTPRGRANILWELIIEKARGRFAGHKFVETDGRCILVIDQQLSVVFKKLDDTGRPSNYPTQAALAFSRQPSLRCVDDFVRVTVGYRINELGTELTEISASCFHGEEILWQFELPERPAKKVVFTWPKKKDAPAAAAKRVRRKAQSSPFKIIEGGRKNKNS